MFFGIGSLDFFGFWHGARNPYDVRCDRAGVVGKKLLFLQKLGKWAKNRPNIGHFEFKEQFGH